MARPRSEKAQRSVLDAMRAALATGRYEAVTIEGLAAEAQVSKQTIYRWWPSKAAILGEALLEGELPSPELPFTDDFAADLRGWFAALSAAMGDAEGVALARALIAVTATDAELGAALNERLAAPIRSWVSSRLERAKAAGKVRADVSSEVIADQFVAMASYAALVGGAVDVDASIDVLLHGIAAPGSR